MARHQSELTDEQWEKIAPLLPEPHASPWGGPKPIPNCPCCEGILWILQTGARWKDLPKQYPSPSTCWRRLRDWEDQDVWLKSSPGSALGASHHHVQRVLPYGMPTDHTEEVMKLLLTTFDLTCLSLLI
jgi:hypothetical protein